MSNGKKWLMTKKQLRRNQYHSYVRHKIGGGKTGKYRFSFFRHKKWFKKIEGHIGMKRPSRIEYRYYS